MSSLENSLRNLQRDRIIEFSHEISPTSIKYRETDFSFPLNTAYLEFTKKCNFSCIHCFAGSPTYTKQIDEQGEMTLEQYDKKVIPILDKAGVLGICITGGEPFFRKDAIEIMDILDKSNIDFGILTNGYFIRGNILDELKRLQPKFVGVSFDSHRENIFEQIRGKNKYKKVLETIEGLNDVGLKPNINCILFKGLNDSYEHIYDFVNFLNKRNISPSQVTFDQMVPEGEGKTLNKYLINERKTIENISKAFKESFGIEFSELKKPEYKTSRKSFCGLGQEVVYIGSNGSISLCPALSDGKYAAGNILKDNFDEIWEYSSLFDQFRNPNFFKNTECSECKNLEECVGGCRAKSMTFSGSFKSIDPWMCAFYKKD